MSRSEPEVVDAILPAQPDLNRILEQQVEAGFQPEFALDLVLHELVMRAVDATGASSAALALARGDEMVCRAATGLHAPDLGVPLNTRDGLSGACLHTRQPQLCVDTESDPRVDAAIARRLGIRSMLMVPVLDDDDLIGVLEVFSSEPAAFAEDEQSLLEAAARDCALILHTAANLRQRPPAGLAFASSDQQELHVETLPPASPSFVETPASPRTTQSLYRNWSLVLGTLAILAAVALSFMAGSRVGGLLPSPPPAQVQQSSSTNAGNRGAPPTALAGKSAKVASATPSTTTAQPNSSADELVVYDHGKVIFRVRPVTRKSGAGPLMAASESTRIAPSSVVWLAPDRAERRLRNRIEPQYPVDALAAHRLGDVVLEVLVAEDGSVASIRTLSGDPLLAAAAAEAVRQWHYEPYRQHDRPSPFQTDVTLKLAPPN